MMFWGEWGFACVWNLGVLMYIPASYHVYGRLWLWCGLDRPSVLVAPESGSLACWCGRVIFLLHLPGLLGRWREARHFWYYYHPGILKWLLPLTRYHSSIGSLEISTRIYWSLIVVGIHHPEDSRYMSLDLSEKVRLVEMNQSQKHKPHYREPIVARSWLYSASWYMSGYSNLSSDSRLVDSL